MAKRRNRKRSGGIAREDYTKGGRVGYQRGRKVVVDRETGEVLEDFKQLLLKDKLLLDTCSSSYTAPTRHLHQHLAATAPVLPEVRSVSTPTTLDLDRGA